MPGPRVERQRQKERMPEKIAGRDSQPYQVCRDQLAQLRRDAEDLEFLERLDCNLDFQKLLKLFKEQAQLPISEELEEKLAKLTEHPHASNVNEGLLEEVKLGKARLAGGNDFMTFVHREVERLRQVRLTIIPELEERLKLMEEHNEPRIRV